MPDANSPATPTPERQLFIAAFLLSILTFMASLPHGEIFAWYQFPKQDLAVMIAAIAMLLLLPRLMHHNTALKWSAPSPRDGHAVLIAAGLVILFAFAVRSFVLQAYLLSRDEQMVLQDAIIFASGQRSMPMQPDWQPMSWALNTAFFFPGIEGKGWLSAYKPVNALIHAGFLKFGAFGLAAPVMAATSVVLFWRIALRIWPDRADVRRVGCVLFIFSAQLIFTAATPFAMTAHLMLNMAWLLFFMKDRPFFHVCAIVTGFLATGLHQVPYHPAFAVPFCALLLWQRRFILAALYAVSYAGILHFWMTYPFMPLPSDTTNASSSIGLIAKIASALLGDFSVQNLAVMASDLVRFLAWNHLLLLPLILIAIAHPRVRTNPFMVAIMASLALTILMKLLFRPMQGHGWGFRYMHGLIGIACLLAAEGWRRYYDADARAKHAFIISTAVTTLFIWPWLAVTSYRFNAPFAALERKIVSAPDDVVIVPDNAVIFGAAFVFNRPDLSNRPIRLLANGITEPGTMHDLCTRYSVAILDPRAMRDVAAIWRQSIDTADPDVERLKKISPAGCLKPLN